ncbi:MAG: tyrosine-type recombinase/integrase, partial [Acidobacteria bacterium]|nr:tyrosine-type recombinase/integrase [Acidobacteriota bacterium]
FWMDLRVNDCRYREPLGTTDRGEAHELMLKRIEQLKTKAPDPTKRSKSYGVMDIKTAVESYSKERRNKVSVRMVAYWKEQARPLTNHFGELKLKRFTVEHLTEYQNARIEAGRAPKTINGEVSVLRQLLKHARLWYRFEDYQPIPNTRPPVGRALTEEEQQRLFEVAQSRSDWLYAYTAAVLGAYCGMRGCEIKGLQWKDIHFMVGLLDIRRSKTPAGWRAPTLNTICSETLSQLPSKARLINAADPEHYVFPWHGREQKIDPTKPITSWRSIRHKAARNDENEVMYAALQHVRFHDLRHTAVTTMAEKGLPEQTIMAQVGHISPQMMKTYSHVEQNRFAVGS